MKNDYGVPLKHDSEYIDRIKGTNDIHELNDEKVSIMELCLRRELKFSKNPYFNKKIHPTVHAEYLNPVSLYKLG